MFLELKHKVQALRVHTPASQTLSLDNVLNFRKSLRKESWNSLECDLLNYQGRGQCAYWLSSHHALQLLWK